MSSQFTQPVRQYINNPSQNIQYHQPTMRSAVQNNNIHNMPSMGGLNGGGSGNSTTCAAAPMTVASSNDNDSSILDNFLETSTTTKLIIIGSIVALVALGYFAYKKYQEYQLHQIQHQFNTGLMHCMEMGPTPAMLAQMQQHGYTTDAQQQQQQNHPSVPMTCEGDKCHPTPVEPQLATTTTQNESIESTQQQQEQQEKTSS